jgi:hypothetical protein
VVACMFVMVGCCVEGVWRDELMLIVW